MRHLGCIPYKVDVDLWMKMEKHSDDNAMYYSYVLFYVDGCLCIRHDAEEYIREINKFFLMKKGSIGDPDVCLGAKLRKVLLDNGVNCWALSPSKYVQEAIDTMEKYV